MTKKDAKVVFEFMLPAFFSGEAVETHDFISTLETVGIKLSPEDRRGIERLMLDFEEWQEKTAEGQKFKTEREQKITELYEEDDDGNEPDPEKEKAYDLFLLEGMKTFYEWRKKKQNL
jgi:hypothetical protein